MATIGNTDNIPHLINELSDLAIESQGVAKLLATVEQDTEVIQSKLDSGDLTPDDIDMPSVKTALVADIDVAAIQVRFNEAKRIFQATDPEPPLVE